MYDGEKPGVYLPADAYQVKYIITTVAQSRRDEMIMGNSL